MENTEDNKKTIKSAIYYSIANIVSIIVSFIAVPIITNILTPSEMGIVVSFSTIKSILAYVILFAINISIDKAILDYKDEIKNYISSIIIFSSILVITFCGIYFVFREHINGFFGFDTKLMLLMFIIILFSNIYNIMSSYFNFKNYYILNFIMSLLASPFAQGLSIILIILLPQNKYIGRIIGLECFSVLFGLVCGIYVLIKQKFVLKKEHIKYGLAISIPIIPHLISQMLLSQSDIIMIRNYVGNSFAGIYSLAYTISTVLFTILLQLFKPWSPWVYRRLENGEEEAIRKTSNTFLSLIVILSIGLMTVCPEIVNVFLNDSYKEAISIVPLLVLGVYFQYVYIFFYDIEYYYKKTKSITIFSIIAAVINIILNMIFIPKVGYIAAGYTTAIGYLLLVVMHYLYVRSINKTKIYNCKVIFIYSLYMIIYTLLITKLCNNILIRYIGLTMSIVIVFLINYKQYLRFLKTVFNKNKESFYFSDKFKNIMSFVLKYPKLGKKVSFLCQYILYISDRLWRVFYKPKFKKCKKKQICVIVLYNLGDIVIWLGSFSKIRMIYPKNLYDITVICQNSFKPLIENQKIFDNVIGINVSKHVSNLKERHNNYKKVLNVEYDQVLLPLGIETTLGSDILFCKMIESKEKHSYYETKNYNDYKQIPKITRRTFNYLYKVDNRKHYMIIEISNYFLNLVNKTKYNYDIFPLVKTKCDIQLPKKYFVVFPSASIEKRAWSLEKYVLLTQKIYLKTKLPLVICGTLNDKQINDKYKEKLKNIKVYDLTAKTSILEFIEIIRQANFVITNDTSANHIALSTNTPVAVIAPLAHFNRFIRYGTESKKHFSYICANECPYNNCNYICKYKPVNNVWKCIDDISFENAWNKVNNLINELGGESERKNNKRN